MIGEPGAGVGYAVVLLLALLALLAELVMVGWRWVPW